MVSVKMLLLDKKNQKDAKILNEKKTKNYFETYNAKLNKTLPKDKTRLVSYKNRNLTAII